MHYVSERVGATKLSGFLICSHLKDSAFTVVRRDTKFGTWYVKGGHRGWGTVDVKNAIIDHNVVKIGHKCNRNLKCYQNRILLERVPL